MSQQTFTPGTQVVDPPAPLLPDGDTGHGGDDNRRKLQIVGAVAGVVVLAIVAFFLLKGGSNANSAAGFTVRHHVAKAAPAAVQPPVVKLPKHVAAPVGRDPFKALYTAPVAGAAGTTPASSSTSTTPSTGGTTPTTTTTGTGTTTTPTYHPVWVQLKSFTATAATFDVGYSNGKTLKAIRFSGIRPLQTFGRSFELLSIRNGVVTVKFGDGSPFQLDRSHNTMVVD